MSDELQMLPDGCGYQGYEFGAGRYPDSQCFGGRLYDMDNCDEPGTVNEPMDYTPCPICKPKAAIAKLAAAWEMREVVRETKFNPCPAGTCRPDCEHCGRLNRALAALAKADGKETKNEHAK